MLAVHTGLRHLHASDLRTGCFTRIRATSGALATAPSDSERVATFVDFLQRYGAMIARPQGAAINEPVQLGLMKDPVSWRQAGQEGVVVFFRQQVDAFFMQDSLIGGKFVGPNLTMVGGCINDPSLSPSRQVGLTLESPEEARAAFVAQLGAGANVDSAVPRGYVWFQRNQAEWWLNRNRFDAISGSFLGPIQLPDTDVWPEDASDMTVRREP